MSADFDVQQQLEAELDRGERIVWQEKSRTSFSPKAIFPFIFVILWFGIVFTSMFTAGASRPRGAHGMGVFPFLFPLMIGLLVMLPMLFRLFVSRQSFYVITNQRALIITLGRSKRVLSFYPAKLQSLERRERADGWGDIVIERSPMSNYWGGAAYGGNRYLPDVGFMNIPEVKNVEQRLRDLARSQDAGPRA